jgi:hypothetical protein
MKRKCLHVYVRKQAQVDMICIVSFYIAHFVTINIKFMKIADYGWNFQNSFLSFILNLKNLFMYFIM